MADIFTNSLETLQCVDEQKLTSGYKFIKRRQSSCAPKSSTAKDSLLFLYGLHHKKPNDAEQNRNNQHGGKRP